ncbi:L-type lectin-domain containing receptor kinase IV.1-like [Mangifera indica]|uniref:L-type lectin-domain containing receptor kinase IV.1-like n=1 Tax=Mangifera indica TaxID=29780 RepID=UPI001CFBD412|nr:L-type lectin-domain containing receptor kinase IV.1-like [Mangifera indica]
MFFKFAIAVAYLIGLVAADDHLGFRYNGFRSENLSLHGVAKFTDGGLLQLTNNTNRVKGQAFYRNPISFKTSSNGTAFSFSTTFVIGIQSQFDILSGQGMAFVIAPTLGLPFGLTSQYLGLFNNSNNGNASNHVFAVEFDTVQNTEFDDINSNHVGIDVNGLKSEISAPAGYYDNQTGDFNNLTLIDRQRIQVWVEYNGDEKQINVTLAPFNMGKPRNPLLSLSRDLSLIFTENMFVGFSSSTGSLFSSHYVLGWSFKMNGQAEELLLSELPKLPRIGPKRTSKLFTIGLPVIFASLILAAVSGAAYVIRRKRKFSEVLEDWELEYGPHRFKYKDLYFATKGFKETELLGSGGFGSVYRGALAKSKVEIAVKRVSHESRQGMREFVAEIVSIGHLRHRNLVQLLGYCRRKGELLLVYDYIPNGSLDKYIYGQQKLTLNWAQRFQVIKGVASGLFYLHEEWEKVVIHRDVKASNVLLDCEFNGRLGDFGLARLYDHGTDPQTTHVVGTLGYLAPEHTRTGKATRSTDVFGFGAFLLEVACGRRPIEPQSPTEETVVLVDLVFGFWKKGEIIEARDPKLGSDYVAEEVELVLKLGLMCSHSEPAARPSMRQVVQYLEKEATLPEFPALEISDSGLRFLPSEGFEDFVVSFQSLATSTSIADSVLSDGNKDYNVE